MTGKHGLCFCLGIIILKFLKAEAQVCITTFQAQPGPHANAATLNCNLQGSTVQIMCQIPVVGFRIIWHYTKMQTQAGTSSGTVLSVPDVMGSECNTTSCALVNSENSMTTSTLTIKPYSNNNAGYYWCERTGQASSPYVVLPSRIVNIMEAPAGVATCLSGMYDFTVMTPGNDTVNCAFGDSSLRSTRISVGIEYASVTTPVPTAVPTTAVPSTGRDATQERMTTRLSVETITTSKERAISMTSSGLTLMLCVVIVVSNVKL